MTYRQLEDIEQLNGLFEDAAPQQILSWGWNHFGQRLVVSSSFQTQSAALLHMISHVCPEIEVLFLDTGFHFPETLTYRDQLQEMFPLNVRVLYPKQDAAPRPGDSTPLYVRDPDRCCYLHKVAPMARALKDADAWISGVRRDQTLQRSRSKIVELDQDLYKLHPMANWTRRDVLSYIDQYHLPPHPLLAKGYTSIGCAPCTCPSFGEDERSGRWARTAKKECGLHTGSVFS